jgi:hypothetical protein
MPDDATAVIEGVKRRLVALAADPPYVFRDTPPELAAAYYRRLTTFEGYSESEVTGTEARLGVRFPAVFRAYLRLMGKSPGDLFRGSYLAGIDEFETLRADALALMAETNPDLTLPPAAVVFLFHQGYSLCYLLGEGGFDGPVFNYVETKLAPRVTASGFAEMVDTELRLMEAVDRASREQGGYYMRLDPEGGASYEYPALNSGDRPLGTVSRAVKPPD